MIGPHTKFTYYCAFGISDFHFLLRENLALTQKLKLQEELTQTLKDLLNLFYEGREFEKSSDLKRIGLRHRNQIKTDLDKTIAKAEVIEKQIQAIKVEKRADVKLAG